MSPEQVRGKVVDARSDVFAFGVVLYELLTGLHPFRQETTLETAAAILSQTPAPLRHHRQDAPGRLDDIVGKMLAQAPDDRYQLVRDVRTDLAQVSDSLERAHDVSSEATVAPESRMDEATTPTSLPLTSAGKRLAITSTAGGLCVLAALGVWWVVSSLGSGSGEQVLSVAVLPLRNLSRDPIDSDYLADGIAQAVTTKLVQAGLRVTPWETAQLLRDRREPADEIAHELNVGAVLMGTFQLAGDRIHATLSLIDADSGLLAWAEEFDAPYADLFEMQRRIATGAAAGLVQELTGEQEAAIAVPASTNVDAYDAYLQGAYLMQESTQEATDVAFQYFTRALELDPRLADAHVGLGAVYQVRYENGWGGSAGNLERAEASYEAALGLAPGSLRARRGLMKVYWELGHSEAILLQGREAGRVGRPDDVETLLARADAFALSGLSELAIPIQRRVIAIDPRNRSAHWMITWASVSSGQFEAAVESGNTYLTLFDEDEAVRFWVGAAADGLGDDDLAREHYEVVTQALMAPATDPSRVTWAGIYSLLFAGAFSDRSGERDRAEALWRRGAELVGLKLDVDPENINMLMYLASFHGLLGEREAFQAAVAEALARSGEFDVNIPALAAASASLGDSGSGVELLRSTLRRGQLVPWKFSPAIIWPSLQEAPGFDRFREEHDALAGRLRERYGPGG